MTGVIVGLYVDLDSYWGIAYVYAYHAYNETSMLGFANMVWSEASKYVISTNDAVSGSHHKKTGKFSGKCNGSKVHECSQDPSY